MIEQLRETRRMNVPYQLMMDAANEIERLHAELAVRKRQVGLMANCLSHIREGDVAPEPIKVAATAALAGAEQLYNDFANGQ